MKSARVLIAALAAFSLVSAACAHAHGPRVDIVKPDGSPRATVEVEIADSENARALGLMYRKYLDADTGMLFVFPEASQHQFWMKNTGIPLDMVFVDGDRKIVGIVAQAKPYSEDRLSIDGSSSYVLEVNGGWCAGHGVKAGDVMRFVGFSPRALN